MRVSFCWSADRPVSRITIVRGERHVDDDGCGLMTRPSQQLRSWSGGGEAPDDDAETRGKARRRTLVLVAAVVGAVVCVRWSGLDISADGLRRWGDDVGVLAPLLFLAIGVGLTCVLVPYPLIMGAAGVVMGTALGAAVGLCIVALACVTQMFLTRSVLRETAPALLSGRARVAASFLEDRGPWGVFWIRLLPGLPFAPLNYAAGLTRLRFREFALGTTLALAPRTLAYTALGGTLGDLDAPETQMALVLLIATAAGGAIVARHRLKRGWRLPPTTDVEDRKDS